MTPLEEAMTLGTRVIAADAPGIAETCGNAATTWTHGTNNRSPILWPRSPAVQTCARRGPPGDPARSAVLLDRLGTPARERILSSQQPMIVGAGRTSWSP